MTAVSAFVDTSQETELAHVVNLAKRLPGPSVLSVQLASRHTSQSVLAAVSWRLGVAKVDLVGKSRLSHIVNARHVAMWMMRRAGMSYPAIGLSMGGRDHTTVMSAVRKVEAEREASAEVCDMLDRLEDDWRRSDVKPSAEVG